MYVSIPMAFDVAIGLGAGDKVRWELLDRGELYLIWLRTLELQAKSLRARRLTHNGRILLESGK